MRKLIAACVVLCLGLGRVADAADLASVVSEDAFLFAEITNPKGMWADFQHSGLRDMIRAAPNGELQFRFVAGFIQQFASSSSASVSASSSRPTRPGSPSSCPTCRMGQSSCRPSSST